MLRRLSAAVLFLAALYFGAVAPSWPIDRGTLTDLLTSCPGSVLKAGSTCPGADINFTTQSAWVQGQGFVSLSSLLSIARASAETVTWADGHLSYVPSNTLAISDLGLQVWEGRTNALPFSNDFQNNWTKQANVTAVNGAVVGPDLGLTGASINWPSATNGTGVFSIGAVVSGASANTKSIYIRADVGGGTVLLKDAWQTVGSTTVTLTTAWQRVTLTETQAGGTASIWVQRQASSPATIYLFGGQVESASPFTSPYIPTTTGSAARAADNVTAAGALLAALKGASATVYGKAGPTQNYGNHIRIVGSQPTSNAMPGIEGATVAALYNGTVQITATPGSGASYASLSIASVVSWATGSRSVVANGGTEATDANSQISDPTYYVGSVNGIASVLDGTLARLGVYTSQLPAALRKSLSTQ